jgi:hypothetical protein
LRHRVSVNLRIKLILQLPETQKDAQAFLNDTLPKVREGTYIEPSKQPLARFMVDEWLPGISATVRPLSVTQYRSITKRYSRSATSAGCRFAT